MIDAATCTGGNRNRRAAAIEVLNGSRTAGVAKQAADRLGDRGMRIARVDNAARTLPATSVDVRPGFRRAGTMAASILDLPRDAVRESAGLPDGVDVRITIGEQPRLSGGALFALAPTLACDLTPWSGGTRVFQE